MKKFLSMAAIALAAVIATPSAQAIEDISIDNQNSLSIENVVTSDQNTGLNDASGNLGNISISSGDTNVESVMNTRGNANEIDISIHSIGVVDPAIDGTTLAVTNINDAAVTNSIETISVTGQNIASGNVDADVSTGSAGVISDITTVMNTNLIKIDKIN